MAGAKILIVDDEAHLRSMLVAALAHHGFEVSASPDGHAAIAEMAETVPDLLILDVMMPGLDGFEVCRRLRSDGVTTPVLFLTARDSIDDRVLGLSIGGDDYLPKPFSLAELVARVNALLRRAGNGSADDVVLRCADLTLDESAHRVTRDSTEIRLTRTEFDLLRFLFINQGRVMSKEQILDEVWDVDFDGPIGIVETYIGYLRRKIDFIEPKLIHTIRGVGYTLRIEG